MIGISVAKVNAQVKCLIDAENALNDSRYPDVIKNADQCIGDFRLKALRIQHRLDSLKIAVPIEGPYTDQIMNFINHNGLLNDIATVTLYKGKAAEALYKMNRTKNARYKKMAIDAYKLTLQLNKGRHWDPKGYFWSPAEAAQDQLTELGQ